MNKDMGFIIISFVAAVMAIIFRDRFAKLCIDFQNTVWGFNFGAREINAVKIVIIIVAGAFIIVDILTMMGIIKFR
jgi:hypothetical protein